MYMQVGYVYLVVHYWHTKIYTTLLVALDSHACWLVIECLEIAGNQTG